MNGSQQKGDSGTVACPACGSGSSRTFFELSRQPVLIGSLWDSPEHAGGCPKGDIRLAFCDRCGFIHNTRFDPSKLHYSQAYDNSLHFSPTYQAYAEARARRLVERYRLVERTVVEIGCGKGDFLMLLCRLGPNKGIGFDVSYRTRELDEDLAGRLTFINDMYGEKYAHIESDLICSRNVLEHIPDPAAFLGMVRRSLGEDRRPVVYFEVPNVDLILSRLSVWDIIYEHCSYFSLPSLAGLFRSHGFEVLAEGDGFDRQFIWLEAQPAGAGAEPDRGDGEGLRRLAADVAAFTTRIAAVRDDWRGKLQAVARQGKAAVIWGGGAKTVSFLNMLGVGSEISAVVDINPAKQGKFLPGTGHRVVAPAELVALRPETVIILNPAYRREIESALQGMGLAPELLLTED